MLFLFLSLLTARGQEKIDLSEDFFSYAHRTISPSHKEDRLSIGKYQGKVIILEFWNRYCSSCIRQMPKLYGLQQKYEGRLQVIPVTADSPEQVKMVYERQKGGDFEIKLATIHSDTILTQRFGVTGYPTAVWLDTAGNFLATTYGSSVSEETVSEVLEGNYSLLSRVARVMGNQFNIGKESGRPGNDPLDETGLINIKVESYDPTASTKQTPKGTDSMVFRFGYTNTVIQELLKLLLLDRTDPFAMELSKDYFNRRIVMDERLSVRYPYWFVDRDTLSFGERVIQDENSRYSLRIESSRKLDTKSARTLGLLALQEALDIEVERQFILYDVIVLKKGVQKSRSRIEDIPITDQVYLRRMSDLIAYLNNNFLDKPIFVLDELTAYNKDIGITLDKREKYDNIANVLYDMGFELIPEQKNVEMLLVK